MTTSATYGDSLRYTVTASATYGCSLRYMLLQADGSRFNFSFEQCTLQWRALTLPLPPVGRGWGEILYLDDELRIQRGQFRQKRPQHITGQASPLSSSQARARALAPRPTAHRP